MWWNSGSGNAERLSLALVAATLALAACRPAPEIHRRTIPVFGTIVIVDVVAGPQVSAEAALDALESLYEELDRDWRSFGDGELGRVNALLATGQPADLSPRLARLVARSLEITTASDGLFDPRVGPLVALWGFQDMASGAPRRPPADAEVKATRAAAIDAAGLHLNGTRLSADAPVTLELAGIAKGSALEAGAELLEARGVTSALIVAGGDVIALGMRGDRSWKVGVRNPGRDGVLGSIELAAGEAALSSGNYERNYRAGGQSFHHIIDPRTGRPSHGAAGTTVIHRDAELGNAAAAAFMVGGPARFFELARRLAVECALLVGEDGRMLATPCMQRRLR